MSANLENSAVASGLENVNFHSNLKEGQCQRIFKLLCIVLISHANKVMVKILQARLQQDINWKLPDVQSGFRKGRGTNTCWVIEKAREFQKKKSSSSALLTVLKLLTLWITTNCGKFQRERCTIPPYLSLEKPIYEGKEVTFRTRQGKIDGFKIGNGVIQDCILSLLSFNYFA